uniref:Methyltransferase FkbM domain-containing protein n=1 Tax=viral metagenome TaxID=1070528 RepID=A0A6C0HAL2_9ZZZZ
MYIIKYGDQGNNIDVTHVVYNKFIKQNIIYIPNGDSNRAFYFTDPVPYVLKSIFITDPQNNTVKYDDSTKIYIDLNNDKIFTNKDVIPQYIKDIHIDYNEKLSEIHEKIKIDFGGFSQEYPEQMMSIKNLTGNEKVLEIGGNIGRNTLIIAYILNQKKNNNLVTLESSKTIYQKLLHNKRKNSQLDFFIENSALSSKPLKQNKWDTSFYDGGVLENDYELVNTITFQELQEKYKIEFDTLVLDCEGAFYYILLDMPEILDNIKLIMIENDFKKEEQKKYFDETLLNRGFYNSYSEDLIIGPGNIRKNFFQVWKK